MSVNTPPLDVGMGYAVIVLGFVGIIGLVAVILLEGLVLRGLRWGGLGRSLLDSLIMNIASAAVGVFIALVIQDVIDVPSSVPGSLGCLPVTWALSVIVEAAALALLRKSEFRSGLRPAVIANSASYGLIAVVVLFTALLT